MEKFEKALGPLLSQFAGQPYIQSAIVAVITILFSRAIAWGLLTVFSQITKRTRSQFDDVLSNALRTPLMYTVLMLGFSFAVRLLPLTKPVEANLIAILQSIGIFVWMIFFVRASKAFLRYQVTESSKSKLLQPATVPLFENVALLIIIATGVYFIFNTWKIDMTAWIASAGIIGMAVGFAAKDTLANLFSGVFILADMPYRIGDYVVLDSGERGAITKIGLRSTRMLTRDDVELTIPNSIMGNSKIVNESGGPYEKFRIRVSVGVAYGVDIDKVRQILMDIAIHDAMACKHPEPRVRFRNFGASSLDFDLLCWIDEPALRGRVIDGLLSTIYKRFLEEDIEIPFTKQDLYIKEMPNLKS